MHVLFLIVKPKNLIVALHMSWSQGDGHGMSNLKLPDTRILAYYCKPTFINVRENFARTSSSQIFVANQSLNNCHKLKKGSIVKITHCEQVYSGELWNKV